MAGSAWKWAAGCGIGCLVIIIGAAGLGFGGFLLARGAVRDVKEIADLQEQVQSQFGAVKDYAPRSGALPPTRLDAFVEVRDAMGEVMKGWAGADSLLKHGTRPKGFVEGLKAIGSGVKAVSTIGRLIEARNRALLKAEMGFGEYYFLYATTYYAWLGHSPSDCPRGVSIHAGGGSHRMSFSDDEDSSDLDQVYRTTYQSMLRRAVEGIPSGDSWAEALRAELAALDTDARRLPWAEGLPAMLVQSLEPYRQRLAPLYWPMSNCLELTTLTTDGRMRERLMELEEDNVI
ncbi:hypothetical protein JXA88_01355 [Candidatus Fermentibacteria bacterium]|nr:hypothetical protein [Candidatus Fermentibacteria bacterium]